jgi:hypothetical protein
MPTRAKRMLIPVMLLGLLWCPLRGWAGKKQQQERIPTVLFGLGEQPCSAWTSAVTEHKNIPFGSMTLPTFAQVMAYAAWMHGFLTAISSTVPGASDLGDPSKVGLIFDKMDSYCKLAPSSRIGIVAMIIMNEHYPPATPK